MVMEGASLYAVGQILGHKTPRMTQRYAHLSPEYMAGAVGKLDRIMAGMLPASSEATADTNADFVISTANQSALSAESMRSESDFTPLAESVV